MIEQQILGTWLQGKQLDLTATVRSEWFTVPKYRTICLTIQAMYLNNEHIDNVAVVMKHRDMAMDIAGLNNYYTGESITRFVAMLHQEYIRKTLENA